MTSELFLTDRELCDLECLLLGAYEPLDGFLRQLDYHSVLANARLTSGKVWSLPVVLTVSPTFVSGHTVVLKDPQGIILAHLVNPEIYQPDPEAEAMAVWGSIDVNHPQIKHLLRDEPYMYLGGTVVPESLPVHYDFLDYRLSAAAVKEFITDNGWKTVVGFQTRNPMHRSHYELTQYALREAGPDAKLLLTPAVGPTQTCDVEYSIRVRCYLEIIGEYPAGSIKLVLLPLAMRMAGPREALHHALIRKNYGCTHFIVGRDHAGPSYKRQDGNSFYGDYDAQNLVQQFADEIGIKIITSTQIVYVPSEDLYQPIHETAGKEVWNISGTRQRQILKAGKPLPKWYTFSAISEILSKFYPPKHEQGLCIYFVGLSGSGKSTTANMLVQQLITLTGRQVTLLDGDLVRKNLSKGLGFSREDRSTNVQRVGWVASEIVRHRGIAVCSTIAPYSEDRLVNRRAAEKCGHYVEIWMNTPLHECEERDHKGLYKRARTGEILQFTGVSDPFEMPEADIVLDGSGNVQIADNVAAILQYLRGRGLLVV